MNQQPDKLFRDKLENYQKAALPSAWDKIALAQSKRTRNIAWMKIAASLLLVAAAGATWMWTNRDASMLETTVAQSGKDLPAPSNANPPQETISPAPASKGTTPLSGAAGSSTNHSGKKITTQRIPAARQETARLEAVADKKVPVETPYNGIDTREPSSGIMNIPSAAPALTSAEPAGSDVLNSSNVASDKTEVNTATVTLTYSAEDVAAYLDKNLSDDATDDEKKQSTLKKLLKKANDLKTNQDTFGELRQRKNEILALNFKTDKRGQKTRN